MPRPSDINKKIALLIGDLILIILSTYLSVYFRSFISSWELTYVNVLDIYTGATTFSILTYLVSFYIFDLYNLNYRFKSTSFLARFLLAVATATAFIAITFYSFPSWRFGRGIFLINMIFITVLAYSWRLSFQIIFASVRKPKVIAIVGAGWSGKTIYDVLNRNSAFLIKGFLDDSNEKLNKQIGTHSVLGNSSLLFDLSKKDEIDSAVIAITHEKSPELVKNVLKAKMNGIEIYDMPSLYEDLAGKLPVNHLSDGWIVHTPFLGMSRSLYKSKIKRLLDIGLSFTGLAISLPISIITALFIKIDSKGPILYRQNRVGYNEKDYELLKFRSMSTEAESKGAVWAQEADPRVTRVGKIIRKTRIDEIPQMWNVLKGEMSFIGPRPERPEFVQHLNNEIPFYSLRHTVKPGISGWAQVNYRYGASEEDALEKLQYDLYYIKNLSIFLDMHILLRTIRVVLWGKGAR